MAKKFSVHIAYITPGGDLKSERVNAEAESPRLAIYKALSTFEKQRPTLAQKIRGASAFQS